MKDKNGKVLTLRITAEEEKMVDELKKRYSVNISQFIRNKIAELHDELKYFTKEIRTRTGENHEKK